MHGAQIGTVLAPKNNAKDVFPASLMAPGVEREWRHGLMVRKKGEPLQGAPNALRPSAEIVVTEASNIQTNVMKRWSKE